MFLDDLPNRGVDLSANVVGHSHRIILVRKEDLNANRPCCPVLPGFECGLAILRAGNAYGIDNTVCLTTMPG